jgi:integrase
MRKIERRFTAAQLKTLGEGVHCDGLGLYLQVKVNHASDGFNRSWIFRYRTRDGKLHDHGLGPLSTLSLAEARERARLLRQARLDGRDPIEERRATRATVAPRMITFDECIVRYIEARGAEWRSEVHRDQWQTSLTQWVSPIIGKTSVAAIDTPQVLAVFNQPVDDGTFWTKRTETASRVRGRIERILDWAKVAEHRQGENPARWRGHLSEVLATPTKIAKVEHHAALPFTDVGSFLVGLRALQGTNPIPLAIEFAVLTAARVSEVLEATWSEIDLAAKAWNVPEEHMKGGNAHRVPLAPRAIAILERAAAVRSGDLIFPSSRTGEAMANTTLLQFVRQTMKRTDLTVHGCRATFKTWAEERTSFDTKLIEVALAHRIGGKLEAAYMRGDLFEKRRRLMDAWAAFIDKPSPAQNSSVFRPHIEQDAA